MQLGMSIFMGIKVDVIYEQDNQKGQFVNYVRRGIQDLIEDGLTLQEIYDSTCVTKDMVRRTAHEGFPSRLFLKTENK